MALLEQTETILLLDELIELRREIAEEGECLARRAAANITRTSFLGSATNLSHYLAMRHHDLKRLQERLAPMGLSTLGRSEGRVLPNLNAVIATLAAVAGRNPTEWPSEAVFYYGDEELKRCANELFGPPPARRTRIMVTMPPEAAHDLGLVRHWLLCGMNCARINCAHDDAAAWEAMAANIRSASRSSGIACHILMDLAGPKPRTIGTSVTGKSPRLMTGSTLYLTKNPAGASRQKADATFGSTIPELIEALRPGVAVWMDDGKVRAVVSETTDRGALLHVERTRPKGVKLRDGQSLLLPGVNFGIAPLTDKDRSDLAFAVRHADIVGYSFVRTAHDMNVLQEALDELGANNIPVVAKIETGDAVHNLPEIIIQAAGRRPFGVMIARGDLALEIGYERLAEIQEEILWICEAAGVPVIWATEVLNSFVKTGLPSRTEMSDAAIAVRAECIMLNKGAFVAEAIGILDDLAMRMRRHGKKKMAHLRALHSW